MYPAPARAGAGDFVALTIGSDGDHQFAFLRSEPKLDYWDGEA